MVEVTLNPPGQQSERRPGRNADPSAFDPATNGCEVVVDSTGRQLAVREVSALEQLDLYELCGAKNSENSRYLMMTNMAASVRAIDGQVMVFPRRTSELRSAIQQLGHDGLVAVTEWRMKKAGVTDDDGSEPAKDEGIETAKN